MRILIGVIFLFFTLHGNSQQLDCSEFKVGRFTYTDEDYSDLVTVRTDSLQTDTYRIMGLKTISTVKWLSDCKYEIVYIRVNDPKMESLIGIKYVIEIVQIDHNKIICRTASEGIVVEKEMIKTESE